LVLQAEDDYVILDSKNGAVLMEHVSALTLQRVFFFSTCKAGIQLVHFARVVED